MKLARDLGTERGLESACCYSNSTVADWGLESRPQYIDIVPGNQKKCSKCACEMRDIWSITSFKITRNSDIFK